MSNSSGPGSINILLFMAPDLTAPHNTTLWLFDGVSVAPHNDITTIVNPGDTITWQCVDNGSGITTVSGFSNFASAIFSKEPQAVGVMEYMATIEDTQPGEYTSYQVTVNGQTYDPKIRVISDKCKTNTPENTSSALANA